MDTPPDASGQRLRWWKEENAQPTTKWYQEPTPSPMVQALPTITNEPLDLEDELEAEARRRVLLEQDAIVIEGNYTNSLPRARQIFAWVIGVSLLIYPLLAYLTHVWFLAAVPLLFVAEYFILTALMQKKLAGQTSRVTISSLGLTVEMPSYRIGPVFWNEIESVRPVNMGIMRFVRVKLKNPKETHQRALFIKTKGLEPMIRWSLNWTHLEIVDQMLPETATEIAARIATFCPSSDSRKD